MTQLCIIFTGVELSDCSISAFPSWFLSGSADKQVTFLVPWGNARGKSHKFCVS